VTLTWTFVLRNTIIITKIVALNAKAQFVGKFVFIRKLLNKLIALNTFIIRSHMKMKHTLLKQINYNRAMGVMNQVFKSSFVRNHTRTTVYKTSVRAMFTYGSEALT
jgi:hypothetical protein